MTQNGQGMKYMPELPEVETVRQNAPDQANRIKVLQRPCIPPKIIKAPDRTVCQRIEGKKIIKLTRRGKYLILNLSDRYHLVVHLRMTGSLVYCENGTPPAKHTHVVFDLSNGAQLHFSDVRQFGQLWLVTGTSLDSLTGLKNLGVEPLEHEFTRDYLKELHRRHHPDQAFATGPNLLSRPGKLHPTGTAPG